MPGIEENKEFWDNSYNWENQGEDWSKLWGGTDIQWYGSILPRIQAFIPTETILEIAPGFGRWTQFLIHFCKNLKVVDLSEKCIDACKKRFNSEEHISYFVNDGISLEMISDESIDFVFSFDSLVHCEGEVIQAYLSQIAHKLAKNGVGFIHHSNIGEYSNHYSLIRKISKGKSYLVKFGLIENTDNWRAFSMTADKFRQFTENAGLQCISQEIVNWETRRLIDCISVFTRKDSIWIRPNRVFRNGNFMKEAKYLSRLQELYCKASFKNKEIVPS